MQIPLPSLSLSKVRHTNPETKELHLLTAGRSHCGSEVTVASSLTSAARSELFPSIVLLNHHSLCDEVDPRRVEGGGAVRRPEATKLSKAAHFFAAVPREGWKEAP